MKNYLSKPIPDSKPEVLIVKRPWGSFKQFATNEDCTISLMELLPQERLSLQSHSGRAELWIVIDDDAVIQLGDNIKNYKKGEEIWIPANERHRLSNKGNESIRVLEVAFGNWQQEDIKRYEDDYSR
jgi:mannose-6-phosphate isomerase